MKNLSKEQIKNRKIKAKRRYLKARKGFLFKMRKINESFHCEYCGVKCQEHSFRRGDFLTVDHIIPIAKDALKSCDFNNFAISCVNCNQAKGKEIYNYVERNKNNYPNAN